MLLTKAPVTAKIRLCRIYGLTEEWFYNSSIPRCVNRTFCSYLFYYTIYCYFKLFLLLYLVLFNLCIYLFIYLFIIDCNISRCLSSLHCSHFLRRWMWNGSVWLQSWFSDSTMGNAAARGYAWLAYSLILLAFSFLTHLFYYLTSIKFSFLVFRFLCVACLSAVVLFGYIYIFMICADADSIVGSIDLCRYLPILYRGSIRRC